jgi:hypothetical protein
MNLLGDEFMAESKKVAIPCQQPGAILNFSLVDLGPEYVRKVHKVDGIPTTHWVN